jgi:sulfatase maturation enzyme AslB (radical SAM superfamily)
VKNIQQEGTDINTVRNSSVPIPLGLHVVAKPMGPVCNLACEYCFYLEKKALFRMTPPGEPGLHYLCEGYRRFFLHIRKYLRAITTLLEKGLPASRVMDAIDAQLLIQRRAKQ